MKSKACTHINLPKSIILSLCYENSFSSSSCTKLTQKKKSKLLNDPHSPFLQGLFTVMVLEEFRYECHNPSLKEVSSQVSKCNPIGEFLVIYIKIMCTRFSSLNIDCAKYF